MPRSPKRSYRRSSYRATVDFFQNRTTGKRDIDIQWSKVDLKNEKDPDKRKAAVKALGKYPELLEKHADKVFGFLQDVNMEVQLAAVETLGKNPTVLETHVDREVVPLLEHKDERVRRVAVEVLGKLKPTVLENYAVEVVRCLEDMSEYPSVRKAAVVTLRKLDSTALAFHAGAVFKRLKEDKDDNVRALAVDMLAKANEFISDFLIEFPTLEPSPLPLVDLIMKDYSHQEKPIPPEVRKSLKEIGEIGKRGTTWYRTWSYPVYVYELINKFMTSEEAEEALKMWIEDTTYLPPPTPTRSSATTQRPPTA